MRYPVAGLVWPHATQLRAAAGIAVLLLFFLAGTAVLATVRPGRSP